jgi:hypothetical protein
MRKLFIALCCVGLFWACGSGTDAETEPITDEMVEETADGGTAAAEWTIKPMEPSVDYPDAAITDISYQNGEFDYTIENFELGMQTPDADAKMCANSAKGQHIHLIPNNEPYLAKYEAQFEQDLPEGEHYILTFLSRSYHESLKHPAAHKALKVTVGDGMFTTMRDIEEPMLFYSRPKGTYTGEKETSRIMLDFYPVNAEIGTDYMVKATINGVETMLDKWQPYIIEGLPMGENTITLTLVDREGNTVDTPLNPVTRTFTLQEMPLEEG